MLEHFQIDNKRKAFKKKYMNKGLIKNKLNFGREIQNNILKMRNKEIKLLKTPI